MAKLLPPLIEGTIPAFYSENGIVNITIPFSMNRAVNKASVSGLAVKIKTTSTSTYLYDQMITSTAQFDVKSNSPYVHLRINGTKNGSTLEKEFCNRIKEG